MQATRPRLAGQRLTAWVLGGGGLLLAAVAVVLHVADWGESTGYLTVNVPNSAVGCAALSVLGALILRRHPRHPIGVLLVGLGLGTGLSGLALEYVALGADGSRPPGATWGYWFGSFLWFPAYALVTTLLLVIFPDGRPPSPRWWPLVIGTIAYVVVDTVWFALTPFPTDGPPELAGLRHPLGVSGEPRALEDVVRFWPLLALVLVIASIAALVTRLARADPVSRRQLEWFALGSLLWLGFVVIDALTRFPTTGRCSRHCS